jgi:hypothetical protein
MDINDHDRHQYRRMRWAIAAFERDLVSLSNLIADLEALFAALEVAPPDRRQAFRQAWDRLRDVHIAAFGPQPTWSEDIVRSALASIKALLASLPRLPWPCCGYLMFGEPPGSHDICRICFWEDDPIQLRFPKSAGGANKPSLMEAQRNFAEFGACEIRLLQHVRPLTPEDIRDPDWRPVDPLRDLFTALDRRDGNDDWPAERTRLYYWRSDFWRSSLR